MPPQCYNDAMDPSQPYRIIVEAPIWRDAINILAAALSPLIAAVAVYIAYQQWRINKMKSDIDLYDRRIGIYRSTKKFLSEVMRDGETSWARVHEFYAEVSEADFLLPEDIIQTLYNIRTVGLDLAYFQKKLYPGEHGRPLPPGDERSRVAEQKRDCLKYLADQIVVVRDLFQYHLSMARRAKIAKPQVDARESSVYS